MRKLLLSLLMLTLSTAVFANVSVTMSLAGKDVAQNDAAAQISDILNCDRSVFVVLSQREDRMGITHIALQQTLDGSPINGAMIIVHCRDGVAMSLNGQYVADVDLPQPVKAIPMTKARKKAGASKNAQMILVIIETKDGLMRWAYETVNFKKQLKVWIDAETGKILRSIPLRHSLSDVNGSANTLYMGTIPMTSALTADGDYVLCDEGRKIYTYDASQWDNSLLNELIGVLLEEDDEEDDEEIEFDDVAASVKAAFDGLVTSSKEYRSSTPDWDQKEIRKITIELLDEQWVEENFQSMLLTAIIVDKDAQIKEEAILTDLNELIENDADDIVLTFVNVCHVEPTDDIQIYNIVMDENNEEILAANLLASFGVGDAMDADNSIADDHISCVMDIYNGPWLDVHAGMQAVYDYYKDVLGRDSYDDMGSPIRQFVNVPNDEDNFAAFPMNACALGLRSTLNDNMQGLGDYAYDFMAYGAGDGNTMLSIVGLDVLAHEFTHLVTAYRGIGDLEYHGESGALNEAISDIMACAIGHSSGLDTNWLIGENVMLPEGSFIRSMQAPKLGQNGESPQPDTYGGEYWVDPQDEEDEGGVHTNSGVVNYWYYLLCEGGSGTNDLGYSYNLEGLGILKATNIVYNSLLYAFTPTATFQDACDATVLMAKQIYGADEALATADAWKAVGVTVTNGIISGIDDVTYPHQADSPAYNLQGIPVNDDYKGFVIKKGQKIMRK